MGKEKIRVSCNYCGQKMEGFLHVLEQLKTCPKCGNVASLTEIAPRSKAAVKEIKTDTNALILTLFMTVCVALMVGLASNAGLGILSGFIVLGIAAGIQAKAPSDKRSKPKIEDKKNEASLSTVLSGLFFIAAVLSMFIDETDVCVISVTICFLLSAICHGVSKAETPQNKPDANNTNGTFREYRDDEMTSDAVISRWPEFSGITFNQSNPPTHPQFEYAVDLGAVIQKGESKSSIGRKIDQLKDGHARREFSPNPNEMIVIYEYIMEKTFQE